MHFKLKLVLALFFGIQVVGIIIGRFTETKYFCWAPYDQITRYSISVTIDGHKLKPHEIEERYHKSASGFENRNINNLIHIIERYETTYGKTDFAKVLIDYKINGRKQQSWVWQGFSLDTPKDVSK